MPNIPKFENRVIDLANIKKIRNSAKEQHRAKIDIWKMIVNCITNDHYMSPDYKINGYLNKTAPLTSLENTNNYNDIPYESARNLINKIYNAVFEEGIQLTLADDLSNVTGLFLHEELEKETPLKKRADNVKDFLLKVGERITASINDVKTDGTRVLKAIITDLVYYANACFTISIDSNKKYFWQQHSILDVSIIRTNDKNPVWFFQVKKMNLQQIKDFFGYNQEVLNKIYMYYPEMNDEDINMEINIEENVFYDESQNISFIYYDLDLPNEKTYLYSKWTIGEYYIYFSINRPLKQTYGKSIAENNLSNLIILQTLTYWRNNISVSEMCPKVMKILKDGLEKEKNPVIQESLWRGYRFYEQIEEKINQKSTFDLNKLPLVQELIKSGINPFTEINTSISRIPALQILEVEIPRLEQKINRANYGSILDQLNNSTFNTRDLKSGTWAEISARNQQNLTLLSPYLSEFLPMMPIIYNRNLDLGFENIVKILIQYKTDYNENTILYYNKEFFNGQSPLQSLLFKLKLGYEKKEYDETILGNLDNPDYIFSRQEIRKLNSLIEENIKKYKEKENQEEKEKLYTIIRKLEISKNIFEQDITNKKIFPNAYFKMNEEIKYIKDNNINEYIIFCILPEYMIDYILEVLDKNNNSFKSSFDVYWTGSTVKRMKNLKLNAIDEAIQGFVNLAAATGDNTLLKQIDWRLYAEDRMEAAGASELLFSKEKVAENAQAEYEQQIQLMQAQQNTQQNNNQE